MSFISTTLTIANAFFLKKQFYPSVVYLTKSSTSMAVIYFQAAVLSYLVFSFLRWIFFGQLRAAEIEHAQERVWHAIMETCLAFTVFRDDFSPKFVVQFVILFFVKAFHWLSEDRVDYMERSPVITLLFHARIMGILSLLSAVDSYFISHAFFTTLMRGASAQIVFGFEYAVLLTMVAHITIKYILHIHDLRSAHPWENKAVYMLYAELFANFLRCALYLVFAVVMIKIHTFPLFAIRPFYMAIRALQKAINDVIQSRRAINAMNNLFPLATHQELEEGDATCIICREEMTVESGAKKLPCNHIFHPNCLRSWFQRQQTCPTCRMDVLMHRPTNIQNVQNVMMNGGVNNVQPPPNVFNPAAAFFNFGANFPQVIVGHAQQQPAAMRPGGAQADNQANQRQPNQQPQMMAAPFHQPQPFFPFAFPPPPPFMHFQQFQQQMAAQAQQNQRPQTDQANTPQTTPTVNGPTAQPQNGVPQQASQVPPPPPFMAPGALPFSFPQPPLFSGFSDDEIREMEGRERQAVENRIQALRNISVLLDAAMLQFQQYMSLAPLNFETLPRRENSVPSPPPAAPSASQTETLVRETEIVNPNASQNKEERLIPGTSSSNPNDAVPSNGTNTFVQNSESETASTSALDSGGDEIRRRRLAKFVGDTLGNDQ
ncbi:ring finger domain-containing protein [Ditylenchus destructor]|uniref:E3 ubiquitin-protein ligase hrd-1 n=1 Tax=Ditylenchus destructor TaxID=166010 RepID=A0AAD4NBL6_9BILA|nr:ring finger domain-containing protein [Ditylenchus destructor]